jgi:hypothetical protein
VLDQERENTNHEANSCANCPAKSLAAVQARWPDRPPQSRKAAMTICPHHKTLRLPGPYLADAWVGCTKTLNCIQNVCKARGLASGRGHAEGTGTTSPKRVKTVDRRIDQTSVMRLPVDASANLGEGRGEPCKRGRGKISRCK